MAVQRQPVGDAERQWSVAMRTFGGPRPAWCEDQTIAVGLRSLVNDPKEPVVT